ncbi:MAG: hypothetical protein HFJ21_03440 [Clostridia bacterium]|jgi:hypothetical protein|nr:hypothetical protein [Clostridia bacterium]MCI9459499.1 hypothetical protein [Clostridia bacterium]
MDFYLTFGSFVPFGIERGFRRRNGGAKGFLALARAADVRGRRKLALRMQKPIAYKKGGAFVA